MTLRVDNKNINQHFISYLKKKMLGYVATILNVKRLTPFDEYFSSNEFQQLTANTKVSARKVILLGMTNLIHKRYETATHIFINPNLNYPGTDIKVVDLCMTINFGNMSVDAYPIFTETFEHFSKNIEKYKDRCIIGVG